MSIEHSDIGTQEIHIPYNWSYANSTARTTASGFVSGDVGKFARQTDDNTIWMLLSTTPTWQQVGGPGVTPGAHKNTHKSGGSDAFTSSDLLEAVVKRLRESTGPTDLTLGNVTDGEFLKRDGSTIISGTPTGTTPAAHKDTHKSGGSDALTSSDLLEAVVKRLRESSGPTDLTLGTITDGEFLKRSGSTIISASASGGTPGAHKDSHKSGGSDAFTSSDLLEAVIKRLQESGGPTTLTLGSITDGQYLKRSGSNIISGLPPGGGESGTTFYPYHPALVTPPVLSNWTQVNAASSPNAPKDEADAVVLTAPAGSGESCRVLVRSAPATPYTVTAGLLISILPVNFCNAGIGFRESSSGKLQFVAVAWANNTQLNVYQFTNPTTFSTTANSFNSFFIQPGHLIWLRVADDGANKSFSFSYDGRNFNTPYSVSRTSFLTADQLAFYVNFNNISVSYNAYIALVSWSVT